MVVKEKTLVLFSFGYLLFPLILFVFGFLRISVGFPILTLLIWIILRMGKSKQKGEFRIPGWEFILCLGIIVLWVLFSGIGGYTYQNNDFQIRNAIFRDLIDHSWPVHYSGLAGIPATAGQDGYILVYYIGFWLPAALFGKVFGFDAANFALYLWTVLGIMLVLLLIKQKLQVQFWLIVLIFVLFSGMDFVGFSLFSDAYLINGYPIRHLEWWPPSFQFSSMTSQLFWVFNQSVPMWVCLGIHLAFPDRRRFFLLWSLSFFFAPLPAIGFLPFALLEIPSKFLKPLDLCFENPESSLRNLLHVIANDFRKTISIENLIGVVVFLVSVFYYTCNPMSSEIKLNLLPLPWLIIYLIFIFLEGIILWMVLIGSCKNDLRWYVVGLILGVSPLVVIGTNPDFCMRVTIPALFLLMIWSIQEISKGKNLTRSFLMGMLIIGALTPIFEINRSIYRTFIYPYDTTSETLKLTPQQAIEVGFDYVPGEDHLYSILADEVGSLGNVRADQLKNYIARIDGSIFERLLIK